MSEQRRDPGGCGQPYYPACSGGSVDVEDLASYFGGAGCVQNSGAAYYPPGVGPVNGLEEAAFAYCTDARWTACPATSYCPLYEVGQPLQSWQALPCAQDFYGYYVQQQHPQHPHLSQQHPQQQCYYDEELLEEYLCVS